MNPALNGNSPIDVVIAATLFLMTAYQRTKCPCVAVSIASHLECLAKHPAADAAIRKVCAGMRAQWQAAADYAPTSQTTH